MRLVSRLSVFALVLGGSIAVTRFGDVQAAPKPPPPTAIVTFENGFDFKSDHFGSDGAPVPYVNGVDNIAARFWAGGSRDLTMNLIDSTRKFTGTIACASGVECSLPSDHPTTFFDGWFLNINQISDMKGGETRLTRAFSLLSLVFGGKGSPHTTRNTTSRGATMAALESLTTGWGSCLP
jgi:hypothetical protein